MAVILSGMGTDGTLGIKAIKEKLGFVMVQSLDSAKFDGMPGSAIATGMADYVAPAEELPVRLLEYIKHAASGTLETRVLSEKASTAMQKIFALVRAQTGQDFSQYKKETIQRRVKRRMDVHLIDNINQYVRYLQENTQEVDLLFKELLIGVTSFFRDPQAFDTLKEKAIAKIIEDEGILRAWVVGCSTGEEAYSIAMVLRESVDAIEPHNPYDIQIFATDIDKDAIDFARRGIYDANIAMDVSPERLQRFFVKEEGKFRLKKEIRDMLIFAPHNITMDPPFTKMDLVSCRNLLIYFSSDLQKKVLPLLHYSLSPGGILFLGPSETIAGFTDLLSTLDNKWKIYQRRESLGSQLAAEAFPTSRVRLITDVVPRSAQQAGVSTSDLAQKALMEVYTPPAVLINDRGDILYVNGRTGRYLEPSPGKANLNIHAMAREGLRYELGTAIRKASMQHEEVTFKGLRVRTNGEEANVDLTVRPVGRNETVDLFLVVFQEVRKPRRKKIPKLTDAAQADYVVAVGELEEELKYTKERLQDTVEQMQGSQEELQSANEELQSSNEELQSTNEELTTSKEELQSLNEELATVNAELQAKVDLLSQANNDLRNLLNSTQIAIIFLDNSMNIRRFTARATKLIKMIDTDIGRPITDLVSNIEYDGLAEDAHEVLKTMAHCERQVRTRDDGRWYLMRVMPYKTSDNTIDGVVMTFVDITPLKEMEHALEGECALAGAVVEAVREPLLVLDESLRIIAASQSFYQTFGLLAADAVGKAAYELIRGEWDIPDFRQFVEGAAPMPQGATRLSMKLEFPGVGRRMISFQAHRVQRESDLPAIVILTIEDS